MSAPAASPPVGDTPVPPTAPPPVTSPPSPIIATPPVAVIAPPVSIISSPPPPSQSISPPPPVASAPPPQNPPSSPPPAVVQSSPPPPVAVLPPPSPPPVAQTPPLIQSPPPTTPSPPAPVLPSPPPPGSDTSPPPVVSNTPPPPVISNAPPPPADSATPSPPLDNAAPPSPSRKRSPPSPPLTKNSPPPPAVEDPPPPSPPSPPSAADPPNPTLNAPVALSPPPPSSVNTTSPSLVDPGKTPALLTPPSPVNSDGAPPGTSISSSQSSGSVASSTIVGIAVGGVAILALLVLVLFCFAKKKKSRGSNYGITQDFRTAPSFYNKDAADAYYEAGRGRFDSGFSSASDATGKPFFPPMPPPSGPLGHANTRGSQGGSNGSSFSYEDLAQATNGFSKATMLGEGGFGCVYKGILPGGQEVAVKQLKVGGGQGEREFRAEVEIITRIHHRHLVTLVGYCIAENQRLLVYEYVPNGTLEHHLHGKGRALLDWSLRVRIALGAARGLAYLHEDCHPKIIHRDIKSSNILLDSNFEAQVADFGLAKLASDTHTHVTTRVMGTFGYLAPEYASSGKLTDKSDIYSFGVVVLELITGRKPVDTSQPLGEESLVEWSRPLLSQALETQNFEAIADPLLKEYDKNEMLRMVQSAAACIRHSGNKRPKMSQIVRALENDSRTGFSGMQEDSAFGSEDYDSVQYSSDLRRFKKMALGTSQEYGSDHSGATSEYGVNPSVSSGEFASREWTTARNGRESEWPLRSRQM